MSHCNHFSVVVSCSTKIVCSISQCYDCGRLTCRLRCSWHYNIWMVEILVTTFDWFTPCLSRYHQQLRQWQSPSPACFRPQICAVVVKHASLRLCLCSPCCPCRVWRASMVLLCFIFHGIFGRDRKWHSEGRFVLFSSAEFYGGGDVGKSFFLMSFPISVTEALVQFRLLGAVLPFQRRPMDVSSLLSVVHSLLIANVDQQGVGFYATL